MILVAMAFLVVYLVVTASIWILVQPGWFGYSLMGLAVAKENSPVRGEAGHVWRIPLYVACAALVLQFDGHGREYLLAAILLASVVDFASVQSVHRGILLIAATWLITVADGFSIGAVWDSTALRGGELNDLRFRLLARGVIGFGFGIVLTGFIAAGQPGAGTPRLRKAIGILVGLAMWGLVVVKLTSPAGS